ncbi:MAG: hypothetical protein NTV80_00105 [Verrucomicrobia bacterium]|nr:hypothetical protein [Verrucomicrobiota bacterium]
MKNHALFFAIGAGMQAVSLLGQSPVTEVMVINTPDVNAPSLDAKLSQLLETANKQLDNAKRSLGDADAVMPAGLQRALDSGATSLGQTPVVLDDNATRKAAFEGLIGSEVFDDNAFGTMTAIGDTVTRKDGTVVNRDAAKYKMDAAFMKQITDYNTTRDAAIKRKKELQEAIKLLTEQMNDTKDLISISKLSTMITALNGQVQDCNQIILISQADAQMLEKEMVTTSRIITKGERERKEQLNKRPPAAPAAPGTAAKPPVVVGGGGTGTLGGSTPGAANATSSAAPNLKWGTYQTKPAETTTPAP